MTLIILKVVDVIVGLRMTEEAEVTGLDLSEHSEVGYTLTERGGTAGEAAKPTVTVPEAARRSDPAPVREEA